MHPSLLEVLFMKKVLRNESGSGMVEYAILIGMIATTVYAVMGDREKTPHNVVVVHTTQAWDCAMDNGAGQGNNGAGCGGQNDGQGN